ncbi:MAG: response regulator [Lachnospiraceae bacterium]|nr:response regulator [Lachnospiraceae bacterium]
MLKLLIVDDEIRVCKLIKHTVDWNAFGIEVIGIEHDGKSAYDKILKEHPDIVITDIRMPEWDGLRLIKEVKMKYEDIYFIITSGYNQFEYAQTAIRYGVEDYLLKPLRKKDMEETIRKISEKYQKASEVIKERQALEHTIKEQSAKMKTSLLKDLLDGTIQSKFLQDIAFTNQEYGCFFIAGSFQIILIKTLLPHQSTTQESKLLLLAKIQNLIQVRLEKVFEDFIFVASNENIYILINDTRETSEEMIKFIKLVRMEIRSWKELFQDVKPYFILSERKTSLCDLPVAVEEIHQQKYDYLIPNAPDIIEHQSAISSKDKIATILDATVLRNFKDSIELFDFQKLSEVFLSISAQLYKEKEINGTLICTIHATLCEWFCYSVKKRPHVNIDIPTAQNQLQAAFDNASSLEEVFALTQSVIIAHLKCWKEAQKAEGNRPIREAKAYINSNFNKNITLGEVSTYVGFAPSYFSKLFKTETQKNFLEYLTDVRIEHAKDILINTNKNLSEVAELSGYGDVKHFSKLFKKIVGLNPRAFRKLYH